jgi:hypothetical protein
MANDKAMAAVRSNNNRIAGSRLTHVRKTRETYDHFAKLDVTEGTKLAFSSGEVAHEG